MLKKYTTIKILLISLLVLGGISATSQETRAASATLYLAPSSGTYVIGGTFNVGVKVNSDGAVVNASEGTISYDTNLLDVVSVSKGGSIFPFWTTEPGASGGSIHYGGGLPPPAYNGSAGHIITITFRGKKTGSARVAFSSGAVLANDGKGTNILASMGSANYIIAPKVNAPPKAPVPPSKPVEKEYNKPIITSSTHPDQDKWYNSNLVKFAWELPTGAVGVSIGFDKNISADPGPEPDGLFSDKEYPNVEDGHWYLHLKYKDNKRWGTIAHWRVNVDTKPPESFETTVELGEIGEQPILHFETADSGSGLAGYEVYIDTLDGQPFIVAAEEKIFAVENVGAGTHTAMVKAIDQAGNERVVMVQFDIPALPAPVITYWTEEIKANDKFFINGTAVEDAVINIYIEAGNQSIATATVGSDAQGQWFYLGNSKFSNGRYTVWAEAVNKNKIKSLPSERKTFLVSPPIFTMIGDWVINYFTVFVSLLFMVILIILIIFWIIWLIRRRLKKETVEIEEILHRNVLEMKKTIDEEFTLLSKYEGKASYKPQKTKTKERLKKKVVDNEAKTLKEIKDVEEILK